MTSIEKTRVGSSQAGGQEGVEAEAAGDGRRHMMTILGDGAFSDVKKDERTERVLPSSQQQVGAA
jgi:hypothetical protein